MFFRILIVLLLVMQSLILYGAEKKGQADKGEAVTKGATAVKDSSFLGIFFSENYPVVGCEILKIRSTAIRSTTEFRAPEREEFNNNRNFSKIIHKYQGDLLSDAEKIAKKEGYNAVIGSKFYINNHYQGVSNLGSVDGNIGYGLGSITFIGHPVYIVCEDLAGSN